jgi:hypothetical protein
MASSEISITFPLACILAAFDIFVLIGSLVGEAGLSTAKTNVDKRRTMPTVHHKVFFIMNYLHDVSWYVLQHLICQPRIYKPIISILLK